MMAGIPDELEEENAQAGGEEKQKEHADQGDLGKSELPLLCL